MTDGSGGLLGRCVVVTRPAQQAEALIAALQSAGAAPLFFPVIEIAPLEDTRPLQDLASRLAGYDIAFFVSANAVEQMLAVLPRSRWPASTLVATVGPGSARALQAHGFVDVMLPASQFDSEGVLELPAMQATAIAGRRVLILRGDGGRELLAQTLAARGAQVDVVSCYRRRRARRDPAELLTRWATHQVDALSFTSSEGARYFFDILEEAQPGAASSVLSHLPCFVPHVRIENQLRALGAQHVLVTDAGDAALIAALRHYFR